MLILQNEWKKLAIVSENEGTEVFHCEASATSVTLFKLYACGMSMQCMCMCMCIC